MIISVQLQWLKQGINPRKAFKASAAFELFQDYFTRLSRFTPAQVQGNQTSRVQPGYETWICTPAKGATLLSSEELAQTLAKLQNRGTKGLKIIIGGAEGFSEKELSSFVPNLKWSFGPMTLPHELAAIVACEQLYRAFTIHHKLPYHLKH
ncbi:MAG: hypothetical protein EXS63_07345 [Candidatus Omnitrophica bacterium]|nr:hypothetical protein [Candidatus Omnitrophota bacterium]